MQIRFTSITHCLGVALLTATALSTASAFADDYPTQPITMICLL